MTSALLELFTRPATVSPSLPTPDELSDVLAEITGHRIPRVAVCSDHDAPFDFVRDLFFEDVNDALVLANRAGGKTEAVAALHLATQYYRPGYDISHIGAIDIQAKRCYSYYRKGLRSPRLSGQAPEPHIRETEWANGSKIEILPGTEAQTQGGHPRRATYDELEQGKRQPYENAKLMPVEWMDADGNRHPGQFVATSTRQNAIGMMQRALDEAEANGTKVYTWCVLETIDGSTCVEDGKPLCDSCPLFDAGCEGRALQADGWLSREAVITSYNRVGQDTWDAQMLCRKPDAKALIYAPFSKANITADAEYIEGAGSIQFWYDWGFSDPTYIGILQLRDGVWNLFDELCGSGRSEREWVREAVKRVTELPGYDGPTMEQWAQIWARKEGWPSPWPNVWPDYCSGDPSAVQLRNEWKEHGIGARQPKSVRHTVEEGQDVLRACISSAGDLRRFKVHPRCLPGSALVTAPDATAVFERRFDGDLIVIRTASGNVLSCTPNHPVLTSRGWLAASLITEGSDVISSRRGQWMAGRHPHNHDAPTSIEEVAEAFRRSSHSAARQVAVSAEDFHGDGKGSEVAVIRADRLLRDRAHAPLLQEGREVVLGVADVQPFDLSRLRTPAQRLVSVGPSTLGSMRGGGVPSPLFGRQAGGLERVGFTRAATHNPGFIETPLDRGVGDAELALKLLDGAAGSVFADDVISVECVPFHGMVYNLETKLGAYVAEGIVTHNCTEAIRGFENYRARELADGSFSPLPDPDPGNHKFSHPTDACRYGIWPQRRALGLTVGKDDE